jgi:hypothetical protein
MDGAHKWVPSLGPSSYLGRTGYLDEVPVPVFVEPMHGRALVPSRLGPPMTTLFNASRVVTNGGLVYKVCAGVIQSLFLNRTTNTSYLDWYSVCGQVRIKEQTMGKHHKDTRLKDIGLCFQILLANPHFIVNTLHPKLRTINLHNFTHPIISRNPREWMFVVQISFLIIVPFLSLISQNLSLMHITKEVHPHPRIATCGVSFSSSYATC